MLSIRIEPDRCTRNSDGKLLYTVGKHIIYVPTLYDAFSLAGSMLEAKEAKQEK